MNQSVVYGSQSNYALYPLYRYYKGYNNSSAPSNTRAQIHVFNILTGMGNNNFNSDSYCLTISSFSHFRLFRTSNYSNNTFCVLYEDVNYIDVLLYTNIQYATIKSSIVYSSEYSALTRCAYESPRTDITIDDCFFPENLNTGLVYNSNQYLIKNSNNTIYTTTSITASKFLNFVRFAPLNACTPYNSGTQNIIGGELTIALGGRFASYGYKILHININCGDFSASEKDISFSVNEVVNIGNNNATISASYDDKFIYLYVTSETGNISATLLHYSVYGNIEMQNNILSSVIGTAISSS